MQEYSSEAIILDREPWGDLDLRISLFTRKFGKLNAKAKSARKITSKLSGHLNVGDLVGVRLVEKKGLQIVDALRKARSDASCGDLQKLSGLLAEAEPDSELWPLIMAERFDWSRILKILGWDPKNAFCELCGNSAPIAFSLPDQQFFCAGCSSNFGKKDLILMENGSI